MRRGRASITEAQFQTWVIDAARLHGWRLVHFRPARVNSDDEQDGWRTPYEGDDGFPDLVLARGGEVLIVELKSATRKPSRAQQAWLDQLGDHGEVWRPGMETHILSRLSRPWTVQRTMLQRRLQLVDLLAMHTRAREVRADPDHAAAADYILTGWRASGQPVAPHMTGLPNSDP